MPPIVLGLLVALAYLGLAWLSALLAYSQADAWSVWLASGVTLGLLLGLPRKHWVPVLLGVFIAGVVFEVQLHSHWVVSLAYGAIELATALLGVWLAGLIAPLPLKLESPRELAAAIAGAVLLAVSGALLAAAWSLSAGTGPAPAVFRIWFTSNLVGVLLVAPLLTSWLQFRPKRSGGLPMAAFVWGAVAAALFLGGLMLVFSDAAGPGLGGELTYLPVLFLALVALAWGARGATLVALAGALIAVGCTVRGQGPFAGEDGLLGEDVLKVQVYAVAMSLTALLVAALAAAQQRAWRAARDWQTRFEAAIGAHRLLAYEWDPQSGGLAVTGDAQALLGVAPSSLATLADWLALVRGEDRERVNARFELRSQAAADGAAATDALAYGLSRRDGTAVTVVDESRAIHGHDGALHRVVGLVRVAAAG